MIVWSFCYRSVAARKAVTSVTSVSTLKNRLFSESKMAKFCANLSFMFTDKPFLERYAEAKCAGFKAVESGFPFGIPLEKVVSAKNSADVQQVLINTYTGDVTKGEMGFAAIIDMETEFKSSMKETIHFAKALGAKKIHIMSGVVNNPSWWHDECYVKNLRHAVKMLEPEGIIGLIEPINNYAVPNYFMNSYKKALDTVKKVDSPNLRIMLDIFHMQHICGNLTKTIEELAPYIGHVQIAQSPNRNEPDTDGEINYEYILKLLKEIGYEDWIGLEYKPAADVPSGLKWIHAYGYQL